MSTQFKNLVQTEHRISRRTVLKFSVVAIAAMATRSLFLPTQAHAAENMGAPLIAFFSRTGNTRAVAEQIQHRMGGDLFEVRASHAYPDAYRATTEQARQELDSNFRPTLTAQVPNMDDYKTVFIGYPSWWSTMPTALFTFLESYNFAGKTLIPFCTHEGSALGRGPADIAKLCPNSTLWEGFAIRGSSAASAQDSVDAWLKKIDMA